MGDQYASVNHNDASGVLHEKKNNNHNAAVILIPVNDGSSDSNNTDPRKNNNDPPRGEPGEERGGGEEGGLQRDVNANDEDERSAAGKHGGGEEEGREGDEGSKEEDYLAVLDRANHRYNASIKADKSSSKSPVTFNLLEWLLPRKTREYKLIGFVIFLFVVIIASFIAVYQIHDEQSHYIYKTNSMLLDYSTLDLEVFSPSRTGSRSGAVILRGHLWRSRQAGRLPFLCSTDDKHKQQNNNDHNNFCLKWKRIQRLRIQQETSTNITCIQVEWQALSDDVTQMDCYELEGGGAAGEGGGGGRGVSPRTHWYGGGLMNNDVWPLERSVVNRKPFVTGDVHDRESSFGPVLEKYWINSQGVAILAEDDSPLQVSINGYNPITNSSDGLFCLYTDQRCQDHNTGVCRRVHRHNQPSTLNYSICVGNDIRHVHESVIGRLSTEEHPMTAHLSTDNRAITGQLTTDDAQPIRSKLLDILRRPVWSTYSYYKTNLNQSALTAFAKLISAFGELTSMGRLEGVRKGEGREGVRLPEVERSPKEATTDAQPAAIPLPEGARGRPGDTRTIGNEVPTEPHEGGRARRGVSDGTRPAQRGLLLVDEGWEEFEGDIKFDRIKFPDPLRMISEIHQYGLDLSISIQALVNTESRIFLNATLTDHLVKDPSGTVPGLTRLWAGPHEPRWAGGVAGVIDLTADRTSIWHTARVNRFRLAFNIDGIHFAGGEVHSLPLYSTFADESFTNENHFTLRCVELASTFGQLTSVQSAYRSQTLPVLIRQVGATSTWSDYPGLSYVIPSALDLGLAGYPFFIPDPVGGSSYNGPPSKDLYIRWLQITSFFPILHLSIPPEHYDSETVQISRDLISLRDLVVIPEVIRVLNSSAAASPLRSIIRPLWWAAPRSQEALTCVDQFLVGDRVMVAPIVEEGGVMRDIFIPPGHWVEMMAGDGRVHKGPKTLTAYRIPLNKVAYFTLKTN